MRISRVLFIAFLLLAIGAGLYDLSPVLSGESVRLHSLGEIWFTVSKDTLNLTQAITQRYLWPSLWDPGMTTILLQPAAVLFAGLALLFFLLARRDR